MRKAANSVFAVKFFGISWRKAGESVWSLRHFRRALGRRSYQSTLLCGDRIPDPKTHELSDGLPASGVCPRCASVIRLGDE